MESASSRGWDRLRNGQLLAAAAAAGFDAVLTVDRGIKHQQNPTTLPVAVVVLEAPSLDLATLARAVPALLEAIRDAKPRTLRIVQCD